MPLLNDAAIRRELERVSNIRAALVIQHAFYASLLLPLRITADLTLPTWAATDGYERIIINPLWTQTLDYQQLGYVILHEGGGHIALLHALRRGSRDHDRWNVSCFPPGTLIVGANRPIEAVTTGDPIYQHHNPGTVTATTTGAYTGNLLHIKASSLLPIDVTPEHPLLIHRKQRQRPITLAPPRWVPAKDVRPGDYLVVPRLSGTFTNTLIPLTPFYRTPYTDSIGRRIAQPNRLVAPLRHGFPLTADTAWFMGLYVAEGSWAGREIGLKFSLGPHETTLAHKAQRIAKTLGYRTALRHSKHALNLTIVSAILHRAFATWFGRGAANKRIPDFILFHEDLDILQAFLQGLVDGDGCYYAPRQVTIVSTASHTLALHVQLALARLGNLASIHIYRNGPRTIHQQTLPTQTLYNLTWRPPRSTSKIINPQYGHAIQSSNRRWKLFEHTIATPITAVTPHHYSGPVYNLETSDHTYLVSNATVHNCDLAVNSMLDDITDPKGQRLYRRPEYVTIPGVGIFSMLHADWAKGLAAEPIYDKLLQQPTLPCCTGNTHDQPSLADNSHSQASPGPHSHQDHCHPGKTCLQIPTSLTADQSERLIERVLAAYETWKASNQRGSLPVSMIRHLERLRAARVPWQRLFHQFAGSALSKDDFSLSPPHRRWLIEADIIRPAMRSPQLGQLIVSIDTSGSVDKRMLADFASELAALHHIADETLLLTHDATVHDVIPTAQIPRRLASGTFHGGGGTSHQPVFEWIRTIGIQPDLFIGLTDLHSAFPDRKPAYPVMWVAPESHGTPPPWGRLIVIPDKD